MSNFNYYVTSNAFENRLYISPQNENEIKNSIYSDTGDEYIGASIRSYGETMGFLLSLIGVAAKVNIGDQSFYINNNSLSKFVIRVVELEKQGAAPTSAADVAERLNALFIAHSDTGYDEKKLNAVNSRLNEMIENANANEIDGISLDNSLISQLSTRAG